jgi:hypothetical protein
MPGTKTPTKPPAKQPRTTRRTPSGIPKKKTTDPTIPSLPPDKDKRRTEP